MCVDQKAKTHAHLHARKRFGINVLAENQRAISEHYADADRVEPWPEARFDRPGTARRYCMGRLLIWNAISGLHKMRAITPIFIAEVEDVVVRSGQPLLYFQGDYYKLGPKIS